MKLRPGTAHEAGMDPERVARLRKRVEGWAPRLSALELVATRRGVVFLRETFGRLRPESDAPPLTKDALWNLVSVSKVFTATAVMMLVEDGLVDIHRPVEFYLPEFSGDGNSRLPLPPADAHLGCWRTPRSTSVAPSSSCFRCGRPSPRSTRR